MDKPSDQGGNSRWWRLIAVVPLLQALLFLVIAAVFVLVFALGNTDGVFGIDDSKIAMAMAGVSVLLVLVSAVLPYALRRDLELLAEHDALGEWDPEPHQYVIAGVVGIVVTFVGFAVSIVYLYQRHEHVGVP